MAEIPFLPGSLEPQDKYNLAANRVTRAPDYSNLLSLHVEFESVVGRMVKQIREAEETQARALLKAAYDAGFDDAAEAAAQCCGCNTSHGEDFDGFLARLLKEAGR